MEEIVVVKGLTKKYVKQSLFGTSKSVLVAVDNVSISFQKRKPLQLLVKLVLEKARSVSVSPYSLNQMQALSNLKTGSLQN
jgi:hypothetical protein